MQSSLQPLMICLPVLGKQRDRHEILGSEILRAGLSYYVLQMMMSPAEQVPKISGKSLMAAMALIWVVWQV